MSELHNLPSLLRGRAEEHCGEFPDAGPDPRSEIEDAVARPEGQVRQATSHIDDTASPT